jgi:monoamine oxidase
MSALVDSLRQGLTIRTGCPITSITYSPAGALLTGPNGVRLGARKVVITASLAVLQQGRIQFSPALPAPKAAAIKRLRFGNAAKVGVLAVTKL